MRRDAATLEPWPGVREAVAASGMSRAYVLLLSCVMSHEARAVLRHAAAHGPERATGGNHGCWDFIGCSENMG